MGLQKESKPWGNFIIRIIVGIGLLAVAGIRTFQLHGGMPSEVSSLPRWLTVACVEIEILLGLWLLSSLAMRKATFIICVFLGIIGAMSFYAGIRSEENLFPAGPAGTNPWAIAAAAFAAALCLVVSSPTKPAAAPARKPFRLAVTTIAAIGLAGASISMSCSAPLASQPGAPTPPASAQGKLKAVTMTPSTIDLGFIEPGSVTEAYFTITNPSDAPFPVKHIRVSCDCVSVKDAPTVVPPRTSVRVKLQYTAPKERTSASTLVALMPADKDVPMQSLSVLAAVGMPLEIKPSVVKLGTLIDGQVASSEVTIVNHGAKAVRPLYSTSSTPGCFAPIAQAQIPAGGQLTIPIVVRVQGTSTGAKAVQIAIHTDCEGQDTVTVQGSYETSSDYKVAPGKIDLGGVKPGQKQSLTITVTAAKSDAAKFVQKTAAEGLSNVTVAPNVNYDGSKASISLHVTAGDNPGPITGRLVISLAGHETPLIVPIEGRVESAAPVTKN